jgi:rhodanese-related sulfurtransferase
MKNGPHRRPRPSRCFDKLLNRSVSGESQEVNSMSSRPSQITATELATRCGSGEAPLLLDVRTTWEFRGSNMAGSMLHPLHQIDAERFAQEHGLQKPCAVICRSGHHAGDAAHQLVAEGMTDVRVIDGR